MKDIEIRRLVILLEDSMYMHRHGSDIKSSKRYILSRTKKHSRCKNISSRTKIRKEREKIKERNEPLAERGGFFRE